MSYRILLDNKIGTSEYKTKEEAEKVAEYIKSVFKDLKVEVIEEARMSKFKAGDKVETPLGLGIVIEEQQDMASGSYIIHLGKPYIQCDYQYELVFNERELKPYKTAHEKLIELGWTRKHEYDCEDEIYYEAPNTLLNCDEISIIIDKERKTLNVDFRYNGGAEIDLELSKILTQYLEEL